MKMSKENISRKEARKKLFVRAICIALAATLIILAAIEALPALMR